MGPQRISYGSDTILRMEADGFVSYGADLYHCRRCHRLIRTYEAGNETEEQAMLLAHREVNCASDREIIARMFDAP